MARKKQRGVIGQWFHGACLWSLCRLIEGATVLFRGTFRLLPTKVFRLVSGSILGTAMRLLLPRRRIIRNLNRAFGHSCSPAMKVGIARGVQAHFARSIQDCVFQWLEPGYVREQVRVSGMENLLAALAKGKGIIALGAHIGNFVLVGTRLGTMGYPFHALFRVPGYQGFKSLVERHVGFFHQKIIPSRPRRHAVKRVLAALDNNEIVFILADNLKKGKIESSLFGHRVFTPRGPVSLAFRSGAAVLPVHLIRNYEGRLELVIGQEIAMARKGDLLTDIKENTAQTMAHLESLIRRYPDQWNWLTVRMRERTAPSTLVLPMDLGSLGDSPSTS